jgi:hypothetical protein
MRRIAIMGVATVAAATAVTFGITSLITPTAQAAELTPFTDCNELRDWYVESALPQVGPYGWNGYGWGYYESRDFGGIAVPGAALEDGGSNAEDPVGSSGTGTNVQEQGVDEPDVAKTNGTTTFHIVGGRKLVITDVSGNEPRTLSRLMFPDDMYGYEMLLSGDTVIVYGSTSEFDKGIGIYERDLMPYPYYQSEPEARILTISVADPTNPVLDSDRWIDGSVLSLRQYDDVVRAVFTTGYPALKFTYPDENTSEREALAANREAVRNSKIADWIPQVRTSDNGDGSNLVECSDVSHPNEQSGFGTISIVTFPAADIDARQSIAVTAGGDLVYSSTDHLYLATTSWGWVGGPMPMVAIGVDDVAEGDGDVVEGSGGKPASGSGGGAVGSDGNVASEEESDPNVSEPNTGGGSDGSEPTDGTTEEPVPPPSDDPDQSGTTEPTPIEEPTTGPTDAPTATDPDDIVTVEPISEAPSPKEPEQQDITTEIHAFVLDGLDTDYVATGEVDGTVKDRWSLSEYDGRLRVATGLGEGWNPTDNGISILEEQGDRLVVVGKVRGLGKDEQIQSVRWFDDLAVMVTFRQTDPLYTVDLSEPTNPTVLGALKIPGFSSYLHPIGENRMVGIGQNATLEGQVLGGQAAVFDLSNLTDPKRIDTYTFGRNTYPTAAWDPRAFTYLPESGVFFTPVTDYNGGTTLHEVAVGADGTLRKVDVIELDGYGEGVRTLPIDGGRVAVINGTDVLLFDAR